jgi:hypothetical protein
MSRAKIPLENSLGFQAQIEDFPLKWCILERNSKNSIAGRSLHFDKASEAILLAA